MPRHTLLTLPHEILLRIHHHLNPTYEQKIWLTNNDKGHTVRVPPTKFSPGRGRHTLLLANKFFYRSLHHPTITVTTNNAINPATEIFDHIAAHKIDKLVIGMRSVDSLDIDRERRARRGAVSDEEVMYALMSRKLGGSSSPAGFAVLLGERMKEVCFSVSVQERSQRDRGLIDGAMRRIMAEMVGAGMGFVQVEMGGEREKELVYCISRL